MRILVTAGATRVPIDQVRAITNIFQGRTGTEIAKYLASGNEVTLLTSNTGLLKQGMASYQTSQLRVLEYRTFQDLASLMEEEVKTGEYDVIIHSSAVSDYQVTGVFTLVEGEMQEVDVSTKISSKSSELFLRLGPTFKIVDKIRSEWGFTGTLVKFKLQVGMSEEELIRIAQKSRVDSEADFIVANCLEWSRDYALIIDQGDIVERTSRAQLPAALARRLMK